MVSFTPLDYGVIGVYVAALLALGFSAKLREATSLQFLAAGRALTLPLFVATLVSTWYGGILGVGESVSYYGAGTILLLGAPYYLFALVYALFFAKRVRQAEPISIPEQMDRRFGKMPALTSGGLVFLLGLPAAHVLMLGILVQAVSGWPLPLCVIGATVVGSLFLYRGGLMADARASTLAFVMMYVGFAIIAGYCLLSYSPAETFANLDSSLKSITGGQDILTIVTFFILGAWTLIDPGFHQRVASAESPEVGKRGVLIGIFFWMLFDALTVTTGMYALALMDTQVANPLMIFPTFGDQILPMGLKALFFCGMIGTILSAMVGYALVSGASFGREIVCRLRPKLDETTWSRIGIGIACAAAIVLALVTESVVTLWYSWGGCAVGALLLPVSIGYGVFGGKRWWCPGWITASMAISFTVSFALMLFGLATNDPFITVPLPPGMANSWFAGESIGIGTLIPGLLVSAIVLVLGAYSGGRDERRPAAD